MAPWSKAGMEEPAFSRSVGRLRVSFNSNHWSEWELPGGSPASTRDDPPISMHQLWGSCWLCKLRSQIRDYKHLIIWNTWTENNYIIIPCILYPTEICFCSYVYSIHKYAYTYITYDQTWSNWMNTWRYALRHISPMFSFVSWDYGDLDSSTCTFRKTKPETTQQTTYLCKLTTGHHLGLNLTTVVRSCCLLCATLWVWLLHFAHPGKPWVITSGHTPLFPIHGCSFSMIFKQFWDMKVVPLFFGAIFWGDKCVSWRTLVWDHLPLSSLLLVNDRVKVNSTSPKLTYTNPK